MAEPGTSSGAGSRFLETVDNLVGTDILATFDSVPTNTINGTAANNSYSATALRDLIDTAAGNDKVTATIANLKQGDSISGGLGTDTLVITGGLSSDAITLDLTNPTTQISSITRLAISAFEKFDLSTFVGTTVATGGTANDTCLTGSGNDNLSGGNGNDSLSGGADSARSGLLLQAVYSLLNKASCPFA